MSAADSWASLSGNGVDTGMLSQAKWHLQRGTAGPCQLDPGRIRGPPAAPESPNLAAWLAMWQDLSAQQRSGHAAAVTLVEFYLGALAGTGTVERALGQISLLEHKQRCHILGEDGLYASLKLVLQDQGGRRRSPLDARALLVKAAPAAASGGAVVANPASPYAIRAQKIYEDIEHLIHVVSMPIRILKNANKRKRRSGTAADRGGAEI